MTITSDTIHGHAVADGHLIYIFDTKVVENKFVAYRIYGIYFYFISRERLF
jgi:hypothetical protein